MEPRDGQTPPRRRGRPPRAGQAAVEFALLGVMMAMLAFGAIEVGRALVYYIGLTNGSREAARKAANCQASTPIAQYALTAVGVLGGTPTISVAYYRPSVQSITPAASASPNPTVGLTPVSTWAVGDQVVVTMSTTYRSIAPLTAPIFDNITLSSSSSAYVEAVVTSSSNCP